MTTYQSGEMFSASNQIADVRFDKANLIAELTDGRQIKAPLSWYPRLEKATPEERDHWKLVGKGYGVHWPDVDEDISVTMLLKGQPSLESRTTH